MSYTDIKTEGWISCFPAKIRPYALLMRLDRPVGWWLLVLPGWWSLTLAAGGLVYLNWLDLILFAYFFIGAVLMRGAGCVINDIWDRKLDAKVERTQTRPLVTGAVSIQKAILFLLGLLLLSLLILLQLTQTAILLGFVSLLPIILYPFMKRITYWPQLFLGLTFNFGALMGWASITDSIELPALVLYASCVFWTIGYDTIYAHQDKDDDALIGIKSTALLFGRWSKPVTFIFYICSYILLMAACVFAHASALSFGLLSLAGLHLLWQIHIWDPDSQENSLRIFKSNRDYGLLVLLALCFCTV